MDRRDEHAGINVFLQHHHLCRGPHAAILLYLLMFSFCKTRFCCWGSWERGEGDPNSSNLIQLVQS